MYRQFQGHCTLTLLLRITYLFWCPNRHRAESSKSDLLAYHPRRPRLILLYRLEIIEDSLNPSIRQLFIVKIKRLV